MVTKTFTKTICKGQRIIHIKNIHKTIFHSAYTTDINVTHDGRQAMGKELRHVQMSR